MTSPSSSTVMLPFPSLSYRGTRISIQFLDNFAISVFFERKTYKDVEDLLELFDLLWGQVLSLLQLSLLADFVAPRLQPSCCRSPMTYHARSSLVS